MDLSWTIENDSHVDLVEPPRPLLSTWHYLRSALRRRWRTVVSLAAVGALLGLGVVALKPPGSTASATMLMAHPASLDGPDGGTMDLSLLNTREVALRTVRALGLDLTPEAFRATVTAEPVTPEVLTVTVTGPDDASAVARGEELVKQYLAFRATQLSSLSSGLQSQYASRIASAQQQVAALTKQYEDLSAKGAEGANQAFDVLARRSDLNKKIADWQETVDNATLQTDAALQSTHVIDPVHADRSSTKRALALAVASGAVLGGALGAGIVVFRALVTDRLRRRKDIGIALGASVRFSVRSKGPQERRPGLRGLLAGRGRWRGNDLAVLVRGVQLALEMPRPGLEVTAAAVSFPNGRWDETRPESLAMASARPAAVSAEAEGDTRHLPASTNGLAFTGRGLGEHRGPVRGVALAAVGSRCAAADVLGEAAASLRAQDLSVFMVDLTGRGHLADSAGGQAIVHQPSGIPEVARGPRGAGLGATVDLPGDSWRADWDAADVVLVLAEVDPGIEVRHLSTWVDRVVPLVTAGAATAELLSTTGDLIREAGFELPFAMMVGCDVTDQSLGIVEDVDDGVEARGAVAAGGAG